MANERTIINLRGYCFFCLKKISCDGDYSSSQSPACTPIAPSPLSTPLRTRCHNVHNLPPEERVAPFTDLCRYLGVDMSDSYAFGDEASSEPEVLYPPLCEKCHDLTARLCILQDEMQYIQTRIQNAVERIHRRVASTCDKRGVIKREEFNQEFRRKSKGSLSRGRGENPEVKKMTQLLKIFQVRIIQKDHENRERRKRRATKLFSDMRISVGPPEPLPQLTYTTEEPVVASNVNHDNKMEHEENILPQTAVDVEERKYEEEVEEEMQSDCEDIREHLTLSIQEYLPAEETLRCARSLPISNERRLIHGQHMETLHVQAEHPEMVKPYPDISTILFPHQNDETRPPLGEEDQKTDNGSRENCNYYDTDYHMKTTLVIGNSAQSHLPSVSRSSAGNSRNNYNLRRRQVKSNWKPVKRQKQLKK